MALEAQALNAQAAAGSWRFHPWNILFAKGAEFRVLDRSRGEWGDPADDVACITSNYLFFSLQRYERLHGVLETLFQRFWQRYLAGSGDRECFESWLHSLRFAVW